MNLSPRAPVRLAAAFAAVAACLASPLPALCGPGDAPPSRIVGVLDGRGMPVAGADVVPVDALADGTPVLIEGTEPVATSIGDGRAFVPAAGEPKRRTAVKAAGMTAVLLPPGSSPAAVVLWPAGPLAGRLVVDRTLASSLRVEALPQGGASDLAHRTAVAESGTFELKHLPPGLWRLRAGREGGAWQDLGTFTVSSSAVEIPPVKFQAGAALSGVLGAMPGAKPAGGVRLYLVRLGTVGGPAEAVIARDAVAGEARVSAVTDERGRFTFLDVTPGVYEAEVADETYAWSADAPRLDVDSVNPRRVGTWWLARRGAIVGKAVDAEGRGVEGIAVEVATTPESAPVQGVFAGKPRLAASADGAFRLGGITPGDGYRVLVSAPGRSPVVVDDVSIVAGFATDLGRLRLDEGWRVEALVRDEQGAPVAEATVTAVPAQRPGADPAADPIAALLVRRAKTDAEGRAILVDLLAGPAFVRASAKGHLDGTDTVREARPGKAETARLSCPTAPSLSGRVTGADGPPPPVVVRATVRRTGLVTETKPAADGSFTVVDLPPWPTDVEARLDRAGVSTVVARREGAMPGAGETVILEVAPLFHVRGTVEGLHPGGARPVARLEIPRADRRRDEEAYFVAAEIPLVPQGSRAEFSFDAVPPGPCAVRVVEGRYDSGAEAVLVDDRDVDGIEILLPEFAALQGTVLDSNRLSFALGARVTLARLEADGEAPVGAGGRPTTVADDAGRYHFDDLAPGAWRVEASDAGTAVAAVEVRLPVGGRIRAPTLVLTRGGSVVGTLDDDVGRGVTGVAIRSERREDGLPGPRATTDSRGAFRLGPIAAGRWRIRTESLSDAFDGIEADVEVVEGETTDVQLGADGRASLEGSVRRRGKAVAGVEVMAVLLDGRGCEAYARRTVADAAGQYRFDGLSEGRYALRLLDGDVSTRQPVWLREGDRAIRDLELGEGSIRGVVRKSSREPVRGAEIRAVPSRGSRVDALGRALTAPDGTFRIDGLPIGTYRVEVYPPGRSTRVFDGVVADLPPAGAPLDVLLGMGARLSLRVTDEGGSPVAGAEAWVLGADGLPVHARAGLSSPSGRVRLDGLPDGPARIAVHAHGYGRPRPVAVTLREGSTAEAEVRLESAGSLKVLVTAGRDPVPRARVNVLRLPEEEPVAVARPLLRSDNRGLWWIAPRTGEVVVGDLEDGLYRIVVEGGPELLDAQVDVRVNSGRETTVPLGLLFRPR